ncbi:MAG: hypothetical protein ACFFEE_01120 [Candidatus Thorarchaeota archaeon]
MITRQDLKSRWQEMLNATPETFEDEYISLLCENDWIRVLVVQNTDIPAQKRIEIEISLPPESLSIDDFTSLEVKSFVQNLIKHLDYFLRLFEAGFTLDIMTREGIYMAHLELENNPSDSLFDVLLPPTL